RVGGRHGRIDKLLLVFPSYTQTGVTTAIASGSATRRFIFTFNAFLFDTWASSALLAPVSTLFSMFLRGAGTRSDRRPAFDPALGNCVGGYAMGGYRDRSTVTKAVGLSAPLAALLSVLVMICVLPSAARAQCDPDNTTGDCVDGE